MNLNQTHYDVIIVGAGASGLMCAIEAGKRGRSVLIIDHENNVGKKILISGGGRCNFTNRTVSTDNFLSHNPYFCKFALQQFTQNDFLEIIQRHSIPFHEREHGQLFCDKSARDIVEMLIRECENVDVQIALETKILSIMKNDNALFTVSTSRGHYESEAFVVASGGLSIPSIGASSFGYTIAKQFGHHVWEPQAGLVPFIYSPEQSEQFVSLSGIALDAIASIEKHSFRENLLFTHKGLSGPVILQISSYWQHGQRLVINLLPDVQVFETLLEYQSKYPQRKLKSILSLLVPKRMVVVFFESFDLEKTLAETSHKAFRSIAQTLESWSIIPHETDGYRSSEVTTGGVDCKEVSAKTMESRLVSGLYFVGEVVDVTGWLGGYNFQWAWSSGWLAGQHA
jgi:predicted Rossmann fold flavoprotein